MNGRRITYVVLDEAAYMDSGKKTYEPDPKPTKEKKTPWPKKPKK